MIYLKNIDVIKSLPNHKCIDFVNIMLSTFLSDEERNAVTEFLIAENSNYKEAENKEFYIDRDIPKLTLNSNIKKLIEDDNINSITIEKINNHFRLKFTKK